MLNPPLLVQCAYLAHRNYVFKTCGLAEDEACYTEGAMTPVPVYRVTSMEAAEYRNLYNYEITLQPIPEDEAIDMAKGRSLEEYERPAKQRVNVSEEVFHSLRVGMVYQIAFAPAQLPPNRGERECVFCGFKWFPSNDNELCPYHDNLHREVA